MKILVVAPHPFFTPRGTPLSVYYRTLVMAEQGAELEVLTYGPGQAVDIPGVRIRRIPRVRLLEPIPVGPSWQKLLLDIPMALWTLWLLLRYRYQVVHAHEEAVFWCRFLKPVFRFRLVYDMHSSLPQQLENFRFTTSRVLIGAFKMLEDSCLGAATAVVTICPDLRDYVLRSGVEPGRHVLIENSIFEEVRVRASEVAAVAEEYHERVQFGPGDRVILYAGTFEPYQGIGTLLDAFSKVWQRVPEARLLLVGGTDTQVRAIRQRADELGVGSACILTGRVPKSAATAYTCSADVLVSPRLQGTNTPLKIYELLASGRPLVATRIWSHTQVLDESVCFLADPDADSLADGLVAALTANDEVAARVRNAMALYEQEYARSMYERKIRRLLEIIS